MKGIILAGGSGTRLYPITQPVSKQLVPIYDKPMIYYPLSTLIVAGIQDILFITTQKDQSQFQHLLGDGAQLGCKFSYAVQEKPNGLAEAFIIGEKFIADADVCLILGDNLFYGDQFASQIQQRQINGSLIFAYKVADPQRYGVIGFNKKGEANSIEEKPMNPKSNYAIPGIYFYDNTVVEVAKHVRPSKRGELEITAIHEHYLKQKQLNVVKLHKSTVWLDTGTVDSLHDASDYVRVVEKRQGIKVGCVEVAAFSRGFISRDQLVAIAKKYSNSGYGKYLESVAQDK